MTRTFDHLFIAGTVVLTVYSQLIMRWQASAAGRLPTGIADQAEFVFRLLISPWVVSAIVATFFAGVMWLLAMTRFELSYAYPFMTLNYVLVLAASVLLFSESLSAAKLIGTAFVLIGIVVISQG
jgi:drug/metabolite transporter (DMT)-like permease